MLADDYTLDICQAAEEFLEHLPKALDGNVDFVSSVMLRIGESSLRAIDLPCRINAESNFQAFLLFFCLAVCG